MNIKRWILASVAVFAVIFVLEFLIHGMLLARLYQETANVWRPEGDLTRLMPLMWLGYAVFSLFFTLIYTKGYEQGKSGLAQGLRYGIYVGFLLASMTSFGWYVVLPIPAGLACAWFAAGLVESVAAGIVTGLILRKEEAAR